MNNYKLPRVFPYDHWIPINPNSITGIELGGLKGLMGIGFSKGFMAFCLFGFCFIPLTSVAGDAKALYDKKCSQCHGVGGDGKGPAAEFVMPRPRDFTRGTYKFRTTPSGQLPSDDDLFRSITNGVPGTSMPAWDMLTEEDRRGLVQHIKTFSSRFKEEQVPPSVNIGKAPPSSKEIVETGKKIYTDMGCANCHGLNGRGNGASVYSEENGIFTLGMANDWEDPIVPANFTKRWTWRGGSRVEDVRRAFATGLSGSPMPAFHGKDTFPVDASKSDEEKEKQADEMGWALAHFISSLSPEKPEYRPVLTAKLVKGSLPSGFDDSIWSQAERMDMPMVGQVVFDPRQFTPSIDMVSIKAVYNGTEMAWLIEWDDRTPDTGDAVVVQLPMKIEEGVAKPFFLGGDSRRAVEWWLVSPKSSGFSVSTQKGWPAKNQKSEVRSQKSEGGMLKAVYDDGRWRVLIKRFLKPESGASWQVDGFTPFAVLAWDGANGDKGAKCAVSTWYSVRFEKKMPVMIWVYPPLVAGLVAAAQWWLARTVRRRKTT